MLIIIIPRCCFSGMRLDFVFTLGPCHLCIPLRTPHLPTIPELVIINANGAKRRPAGLVPNEFLCRWNHIETDQKRTSRSGKMGRTHVPTLEKWFYIESKPDFFVLYWTLPRRSSLFLFRSAPPSQPTPTHSYAK